MSCQHETYIVGCEACRARQSRRRFFVGVAAAGVALALPKLPGPATWTVVMPPQLHYSQILSIPQRKVLARIRISGEMIEASRHAQPGEFMRAAAEEYRQMAADAAKAFDRELVERTVERVLQPHFIPPAPVRSRTVDVYEDGWDAEDES